MGGSVGIAVVTTLLAQRSQLLAYADDFWLLAVMFTAVPLFLPLMRRIRLAPSTPATAPGTERAVAHAVECGRRVTTPSVQRLPASSVRHSTAPNRVWPRKL